MTTRPIALTMGEPAGVGAEIALKAWMRREELSLPPFFLLDDPRRLARLAEKLNWRVDVAEIDVPADTEQAFDQYLPVLPRPLPGSVLPGTPNPANARAVLSAIEDAAGLVQDGAAAALVTNPINKAVLYEAGFSHPGHTEYLAELAGPDTKPVMMLACPGLRVVPVTIHIPLREVAERLDQGEIECVIRITAHALKSDFGVKNPQIVVAGLNPHAGEGGAMGREEIEIIKPAVDVLKSEGIHVLGPAPADTLFHERMRPTYDAAICMYHDQALIPIKTIDFHNGVNITLGLPFVRTSPDHGTAFEIAGTGVADERSLVAAIREAAAMAERRAAVQ
ncbi:MAG: 4-hydroxythreonine-4-phosphate dehydrogenase PdxA [Alphaproteobacteria bacterium]|nr:4-hydroxythreonine-4-phosphate dehydrogenase PdxA [Alphaproteobacteria bacterium]MCK5622444.1 4-hydroxythreonine-4-phosphate dehydrogenase PdxA [Alphaproteobacteria bacterium]